MASYECVEIHTTLTLTLTYCSLKHFSPDFPFAKWSSIRVNKLKG